MKKHIVFFLLFVIFFPTLSYSQSKRASRLFFPINCFVVNISDRKGTDLTFLRICIEIECKNERMKAELGNNLPEIKDSFLFVLSNKLAEDLLTIKGKTILRNELSKKVNQILDPGKITNIWFTGFVME